MKIKLGLGTIYKKKLLHKKENNFLDGLLLHGEREMNDRIFIMREK